MPETIGNNEVAVANCETNNDKSEDESGKTPANPENGNITPVVDEVDATTINKDKEDTTANYDLNQFELQRILNNNTRNKSIALLGSFPNVSDSNNAIVIFEKHAFQEADVATKKRKLEVLEENGESKNGAESEEYSYFGNDLKVQTEFINNIYGSYQCTPPSKLSGVKATVVYPATEKHIEKYSICQKYLINETPEFYKDITLPYITSSQLSMEWVYNILDHKQEAERIITEDADPEIGFILLPDLKWDGHNKENLYVLAIIRRRDVKSLRDLNSSHLPLLRNIRSRAAEEIKKHYGLVGTQLRMYLHYQPTFYHLHVHINPVRNDAPGIWCEKSHMLDTVINNLELMPDYYEKATLPFVVYEGNKLLELYEAKMPIRNAVNVDEAVHLDEAVQLDKAEGESESKKRKIADISITTGSEEII